ncbi:MAG TPA: hypothetical protein QGF58_01345 [Myxococcota bacterium]|nr:hypothetical protein [Myxococcota bacterium]
MDARIVDTQSASVLHTAASQGPVADWVAVEKDVVASLLADVELSAKERRALMVDTPTESFDALTAWSEGLELESEGRIDAARAAYAEALKLDPEFAEAQADLAELRARAPAHFAYLRRAEIVGDERLRVAAPAYWAASELIVGTPNHWDDEVGFELGDAIVACGEDSATELAALRVAAADHGLAGEVPRHGSQGLTVDDRLAVLQAFVLAGEGASSQLTKLLDDLLARHAGEEQPRARLESYVEDVLRVAEGTADDQRARLGRTPEELMLLERAILEGDTSIVQYGEAEDYINELGMVYGPLRDFGCLDEPAKVSDPYEAAAFLEEAARTNLRARRGLLRLQDRRGAGLGRGRQPGRKRR